MVKYTNGYVIRITPNFGRRESYGRYYTKRSANQELKRLLSKQKGNKTSYRNAISGGGINNPRIKKVRLIR